MRVLQQIPLQRKVSLAMFLVTACLMAIAFSAMFSFQLVSLRSNFEDDIDAIARIAAKECADAVSHNNRAAATQTLESLRELRFFHSAWIDIPGDRTFAAVATDPPGEPLEGGSFVEASAPILNGSRLVGTLWVAGDFGAARTELLTFFIRLATGVTLVCVLVGWLLVRGAQQFALRPVLELARAAERVARERDLSLRVDPTSEDEIGTLTHRFNDMLAQIESQDRQLKNARKDLESKVVALEFEISERRRIEAGLAEVTQREERRLANDLHDGLGQLLTGIAFKAHLLKTLLVEKNAADSKLANDVVELANESIRQARNIAHGVAPVELAGAGLSSALVQLGAQIERLMGAACAIRVPDELTGMPLRTSIELYRICQEAAHNAARHGHATRIDIVIVEKNGVWCLEIRDNGTGLPPPSERHDGLGLRLMAHRAESVGGTIAFVSNEAGGLTVRCVVPMAATQPIIPAQGAIVGN